MRLQKIDLGKFIFFKCIFLTLFIFFDSEILDIFFVTMILVIGAYYMFRCLLRDSFIELSGIFVIVGGFILLVFWSHSLVKYQIEKYIEGILSEGSCRPFFDQLIVAENSWEQEGVLMKKVFSVNGYSSLVMYQKNGRLKYGALGDEQIIWLKPCVE